MNNISQPLSPLGLKNLRENSHKQSLSATTSVHAPPPLELYLNLKTPKWLEDTQMYKFQGGRRWLTIGVTDAEDVGDWLAALVQHLHLLTDWHKASPVHLRVDRRQV
jgi:hypothetical protein